MNHVLTDINVSCFTHKQSVAQLLLTGQLTNVLPTLQSLNAITTVTPLTGFVIKSFTTNKIHLHGARSGFETESPVTCLTLRFSRFDLLRKTCLKCCSLGRHALSCGTGVRGSNGTEATDLSAFGFSLYVETKTEIVTVNTGQYRCKLTLHWRLTSNCTPVGTSKPRSPTPV